MLLLSYNSRPMSVLLPSSTLPAVVKRRREFWVMSLMRSSEIPFFFAVLHGGFAAFVIDPSPAFRDAGRGHFCGDFLQRIGVAFNGAGDGQVTQGAESDPHVLRCFAFALGQSARCGPKSRRPEQRTCARAHNTGWEGQFSPG